MQKRKSSGTESRLTGRSKSPARLSSRTRKQIDALPAHARHIFQRTHTSALKHYRNPARRRGGKGQSRERVAHMVAWAAVKKKYRKEGNRWVRKG